MFMIDRINGVFIYILDNRLVYFSLVYLMLLFILWHLENFIFLNFFYLNCFYLLLLVLVLIFRLKKLLILLLSFFLVTLRIFLYITWEEKIELELDDYLQSSITVRGFISKEPDYGHNNVNLVLKVVEVNGKKLKNEKPLVLFRTLRYPEKYLGDYCRLEGILSEIENFDDEFDYKTFMRNKKIFYNMRAYNLDCSLDQEGGLIIYNRLYKFKRGLVSKIEKALPEPQASLLIGIILGEERLFEDSFEEALRISGTTHIVAASGYNITLILLMVDKSLKFINKKLRFIIAIIFIWLFVLISGVSVSIVRAAIMGSLTIMAGFWGYKSRVHNIVPVTVLIYALINPRIIYDIGFQLSLFATLGLIYIMPVFLNIRKQILGEKEGQITNFTEILFSTVSCTLATLPVSINTFGVISIISIVCNLLLLPVLDLTMFIGLIGLIFLYIWGVLGELILLVAWVQLKYFELVVRFFGGLYWIVFEIEDGRAIFSLIIIIFLFILVLRFYPIDEENYYFNR